MVRAGSGPGRYATWGLHLPDILPYRSARGNRSQQRRCPSQINRGPKKQDRSLQRHPRTTYVADPLSLIRRGEPSPPAEHPGNSIDSNRHHACGRPHRRSRHRRCYRGFDICTLERLSLANSRKEGIYSSLIRLRSDRPSLADLLVIHDLTCLSWWLRIRRRRQVDCRLRGGPRGRRRRLDLTGDRRRRQANGGRRQ